MEKITKWPVTMPMLIGFISLVILICGFGAWSMNTKISGAIIATGKVKVEENQFVLQHLYGGIIKEIYVKEGSKILKNETLIILDGIQPKSQLKIIEFQLFELIARRNRLEAERDEKVAIKFNDELVQKSKLNNEFKDIAKGQNRLFEARLKSFKNEAQKTNERILQIRNQIQAKLAQNKSNFIQLELIQGALSKSQSLYSKGLNIYENVLEQEMEKARLQGEIEGLKANVSELEGKITELQIELLRLRSKRREQSIENLRDIQTRENEIFEKRNSLVEQINRLKIQSPIEGIVHNMQVFAKDNIIKPGEPILYIVPLNKPLIISSKVDTLDIDQLYLGQEVTLRFSSFDQKNTPELKGKITRISPDALEDRTSGFLYYDTEIETSISEIEKLGKNIIVPGMPVEAYIKTNERTPLSFLTKPITDYFYKSFRGT